MSSEEDGKKKQAAGYEGKIEDGRSLRKNDNRSGEQNGKSLKVIKASTKVCAEQSRLNNNNNNNNKSTDELDTKSVPSSSTTKPSVPAAVINRTCSTQSTLSSSNSSLTREVNEERPNSMNARNLPKSQMQLNLSFDRINPCSNHSCVSLSHNSNSPMGSSVHLSMSVSNTSVTPQSVSLNASNEDVDIKNNVDCVSGIEKCPSKVSCSSDSSPSSSYVKDILNNIGGSIGSTSQGTCCFPRPNINGNREIAGPSGLSKNLQRGQMERRRDSSSGNEGDTSDGEDYCIYTYKGNDDNASRLAQKEEPNEARAEEQQVEGQILSGRSSPEMDFLEMDFDPGPSCEQDTGDSDMASINEEIQNIALDNLEPDPVLNDLSGGRMVAKQGIVAAAPPPPPPPPPLKVPSQNFNHAATLQQCPGNRIVADRASKQTFSTAWRSSTGSTEIFGNGSTYTGRWETAGFSRNAGCPLRESCGYHNTSGDLISPGDNRDSDLESSWVESSTASTSETSNFNSKRLNLSSTLYHRMMAKKLMLNKQAAFNESGDSNLENELCEGERLLDGLLPVEKAMLWSEQEATAKQVTQIATSACGATAAINALLALNVPFSPEVLVKGVATRLRELGAPLPRYLVSRSIAGSSHKDIARGISLATNGAAITKFFPFYPERKVSLSHWLHYWISRGAAPIATLNLQHCGEGYDIPDAWHHQMIFGVGPAGVYLTNPLQCLPEQLVWHQLVSPSVLLIRRADVLARWNANTDLTPLARMDRRWRKLNVLGQVVHVVREATSRKPQGTTSGTSTHIRIPACYRAGITLVLAADCPAAEELLHAEQLPLL